MADPRTLPATAPVVGRRPSGWRAPGLPGAEVCFRVAEGPSLYRPRYPERTPLWKLFDEHYLDFTRVHEERFEHEDGPLRTVVTETVTAFLDCGVLRAGFARVCCPECHAEYLLAFSCKGRGLCPSCQAKRAELFAEKLREEILAPLAHRHVVFTIPKALRKLFLRERALLDLLPR
ncbi:MAG: transposase zinc-binding domain-containing protein, partial [Planctomycetes bacterium]|nr:transposase zinc-binding domain-containing protein [Planctomycetota bacterium]